MKALKNAMKRFWKDEEGLTATEYALVGALVVVGIIAAFTALGTNIGTKVQSIADTIGAEAIE